MTFLKKDILTVLENYPLLKWEKNGHIVGEIEIKNTTGTVLESFTLDIIIPGDFPNSRLPVVTELSNKLPRNKDAHIYTDGTFCLVTPLQEYLICRKGITFKIFMETILTPFLAAQLAIQCGYLQSFPQGEYSHGNTGILESYRDFFGIEDAILLIEGLNMSVVKNNRNLRCFCNSGKKLKNCHLIQIELLNRYNTKYLFNDINVLKSNFDLK